MCGICGFYGKGNKELIEKMNSSLIHRGPDSLGKYLEEDIGLGVRRLAITGINSGDQPVFNEEQNIVVVFNGEIYNFQNLRRMLESQNHSFESKTDTEVIVHLYEEYGENFVNKLNGMFSIAIWDKNLEKLILCRDRLGIKPLFYYNKDKEFYFGSEIEAILKTDISPEPDIKGLSYFWDLRYIPAPYTAFKDIKALEPGHILVIDSDNFTKKRYWNLDKHTSTTEITEAECVEQVEALVTRSVKNRIPSEVSFGVLLSGGLDSSTLVALIDELTDEQVKTFSVIFEETNHDERKYSRLIAEKFDTDHNEYLLENNIDSKVEDILSNFSNPVADPAIIPTHLICSEASNQTKVILSGTGSDEIFGGYQRYNRDNKRFQICNLFPRFSKYIFKQISDILPKKLKLQSYFEYLGRSKTEEELFYSILSLDDTPIINYLEFRKSIEKTFSYEKSYLSKINRFDIVYWLPNMLLTKIDRCSMNNSLEGRVPFLDHRLVNFSRKIPWDYKIKDNVSKMILRKAFSDYLPDEIANREGTGLSVPIEKWIKNEENSISARV